MNKFRILSNASKGKRPELDDSIPNSYQKMIKRCFEEKESDRPTIKEIIDLLQNNREFIIDGANEDEYKEFIKRCKSKEKSEAEKVSSKEFNDLKKENEELRSKIEEYESVMLPYSHSKLEENYFVGEDDETNFESQGKIGEGATAITYKVIDKRSNAPLCKKVIKISKNQSTIKDAQNALKEFEVLHLQDIRGMFKKE